jgi:hypothetical protein
MAVTFRSDSSLAYTSRTNTTITAPAGIQDDDVLLIIFEVGGNPPTTPTPPSGFTSVGGSYPINRTPGGFSVDTYAWYKVANGETGDYTVTHATASTTAYMLAASGADTADPIEPAPTGQSALSTTAVAPGLTTATDDSLVVFWAGSFDVLGAVTPPSGSTPTFTERMDSASSILYVATGVMATAGATGDKTVTVSQDPYGAGLIAIAADEGGAEPQTITPGLITDAPTLHSPTVNLGALTITPGLITDGPTLHSPTVNAGALTVTPGLISDPPALHAPTIVLGALTVTPGLINDPPTLHAPTVSAVVTITPGLITDSPTLHSPNVVLGSLTIAPDVINDPLTLHSPTVQAGSLTISPGLITDEPTLHPPTISTVFTISPGLIADPPTLHAPTVQIGALTITPGLITDLATLHAPTVVGGDEPEQIPVYVTVELSATFPNQISLQAPIGNVLRL